MADASLVATGAVACIAGTFLWLADRRKHREHVAWCNAAAKAEGVVSRKATRGHLSKNEPTDSDEVSVVPVVRFRAANGVEYEFDAPDAPRKIGAPVAVAYDPALPSSARPIERVRKIGFAVIALLGGLVTAGWGLLQ